MKAYLVNRGWSRRLIDTKLGLALLEKIPERVQPTTQYDFGHWDRLPKASCQCITYGRTTLLDEAVECFLRQDYPGEKELVILNDLPQLELRFEHPLVKIINLPYRMRTIGEKRNACVALCTGDVIFPWDDDDISLPHRLSYSIQQMKNRRYFKADRAWFWRNGTIDPMPPKNVFHPMGCWSRELFDQVGGYPHIQSGQDVGLEELFKGKGRWIEETPTDRLYYVYRFPGTGSYHLSAWGYGNGYNEVEEYVRKKAVAGIYEIRPCWRLDYVSLVKSALTVASGAPLLVDGKP